MSCKKSSGLCRNLLSSFFNQKKSNSQFIINENGKLMKMLHTYCIFHINNLDEKIICKISEKRLKASCFACINSYLLFAKKVSAKPSGISCNQYFPFMIFLTEKFNIHYSFQKRTACTTALCSIYI